MDKISKAFMKKQGLNLKGWEYQWLEVEGFYHPSELIADAITKCPTCNDRAEENFAIYHTLIRFMSDETTIEFPFALWGHCINCMTTYLHKTTAEELLLGLLEHSGFVEC